MRVDEKAIVLVKAGERRDAALKQRLIDQEEYKDQLEVLADEDGD